MAVSPVAADRDYPRMRAGGADRPGTVRVFGDEAIEGVTGVRLPRARTHFFQ